MGKFNLTEEDRKYILSKYYSRQIINEQKWLSKFFAGSADDVVRNFGDDAVKTLDDIFAKLYTRSGNLISKAEGQVIKSLSGAEIPVKTIQDIIKYVGEGKMNPKDVIQYIPRRLADGTEFRNLIEVSFEKKGIQKATQAGAQSAAKNLSAFEQKFLLKNCFSNGNCDVKSILSNFNTKLANIAKLPKFDPSKVLIVEESTVSGRKIIDVQLENGDRVLFYESSGSNVASTGKEAGEWFVIPGFAESGWFFKTHETIAITKGGNKYLTEMAQYLENNGFSTLPKLK